MGVEPPTSTESSWESNLLLLQKGVDPLTSTERVDSTLSLLQKAVASRPSHFYRKQLRVDPLISSESSWESTLHFYRKQLGVDPPTSTESSWESTLSILQNTDTPISTESSWESILRLRQEVVGSRTSYFYRKELRVEPPTTTESSWESNLLLRQKAVVSRPSHFYRKQL